MRKLIKQRELIDDSWRYADEDPQAAQVIVPFARWAAEREQWLASGKQLGVRIGPADKVDGLAADLPRLSLVAVEFGGLAEGRGYSQAHLLRRRYGFKGELRAVGKIQRDQLFYMARCGFDAFELPEGADFDVAFTAFKDFSVAYQPAVDQGLSLRRRAQ
jgi:uncharacterized protein (DUF934 family)